MIDHVTDISSTELLGVAQKMFFDGYRFVTATCVENSSDNTFDLLYHFDLAMELVHYRLNVTRDEEVPSISKIFFSALLVENEIKELFGVQISNIVIDYGGHLLLSDGAPSTPMASGSQITVERREGNS